MRVLWLTALTDNLAASGVTNFVPHQCHERSHLTNDQFFTVGDVELFFLFFRKPSLLLSSSARQASSYTVGLASRKWPFSTEAQVGLSYSRKIAFSTQRFSSKFFDWRILPKESVEKVLNVFFNPSHCSSHHNPAHTLTPGTTQQNHTTA